MPAPRTVIAFDFGLRRIGVAVGQDITGSASPLGVVDNYEGKVDFAAIERLIDEWRPGELVVGLPLHADGAQGTMTDLAQKFATALQRFKLPVHTVDERYTSLEAERVLKDARAAGSRGRLSRGEIDSAAATLIAERYLAGG